MSRSCVLKNVNLHNSLRNERLVVDVPSQESYIKARMPPRMESVSHIALQIMPHCISLARLDNLPEKEILIV